MESSSRPPAADLPVETHLVASVGSPELGLLESCLARSAIVGLDAEWKPRRRQYHDQQPGTDANDPPSSPSPAFPTVTVLQIACRCRPEGVGSEGNKGEDHVFVVDLMSVPAAALWGMLRDMFVCPNVIKLGFRFKQDLIYLSSTFSSQGCHPGFDRVEPFLDITNIYHYIKSNDVATKMPKDNKSLGTICKEVLGVSLSKELQCSDWSCRPLTEEQIAYAAADAYYLIELFEVFEDKVISEGISMTKITEYASNASLGLKEIFDASNNHTNILSIKFCEASSMIKSSGLEFLPLNLSGAASLLSYRNSLPLSNSLSKIIKVHCEQLLLKESDRMLRTSKKKGRKQSVGGFRCKEQAGTASNWEGPPPWDPSLGGDGCPKFLCDVMVEGLAKHLRCVGIDAATPSSKKPEPRQLITQTHKEKRVLLTRDTKLMKHQYLIENQVYKVKNLRKNEQLMEVIETFQLKIYEDQLMSRCTKCNGCFIQKPLSLEEAIEASRGFQIIPDCLFKQDLEFWQCTDCNQLYWEGTQYHNAVEKFINVCKLKD